MTVTRRLGVFGLSVEDVADRLSDQLTAATPNVTLENGENEVFVLLSVNADSDSAVASLDDCTATVRDRLGTFVYGEDVPDLQHRVVSLLLEKNKKIATAESCTAGLLSASITEVGGSSAVFDCGVASYANEIKHSILGVPDEILETYGAVSEQVAAAMATGVRRLSDADFGIGITGVAGPGPSDGIPAGTVFIALADEKRVWVKKIEHKNADREGVRRFAVQTALDLSRRYLEALPGVMAGALSLEKPSSETMPFPVGRVKKLHFWSPLFPSKSQGKAAAFRAAGLWTLIVLLLGGVAFSSYYFIYRPFHNEQIYDRLETVYYAGLADTSAVVDISGYPEGMLSRFYALYDQNTDIRGWLKVDGTSVSYPVMDSRHSDYYDTHDFERQSSAYGVPYFSAGTDFSSAAATAENQVLTVYGRGAGSDQMLSPLLSYADPAFYAAHEYLSLNTLYSEARYRVMAVIPIKDAATAKAFSYDRPAQDAKSFAAFLNEVRTRSLYRLPSALNAKSNLLVLSVDASEEDTVDRLVIVAEKLANGTPEPAFKVIENDEATIATTASSSTTTVTASTTTTTRATTAPIVPPPTPPTSPTARPTVPTAHPTTTAALTTTRKTTEKPTEPTTTEPTSSPTSVSAVETTGLPTVFSVSE